MALVWQNTSAKNGAAAVVSAYLIEHWTWGNTDGSGNDITLYLDEAKKIGIHIESSGYNTKFSVRYNSTTYHEITIETSNITTLVEITNTALIISFVGGDSISASNCNKLIVCNGYNPNTDTTEPILLYLGSNASSNVCAMYASDVVTPSDIAAQDADANVNAKSANMIPFYNPVSSFITTDVYQSLCENISSWFFGDVTVNNYRYRMSGSVFALDE